MSNRTYYLCKFIFGGSCSFVIWYSDRKDGLLVNRSKKIFRFEKQNEAMEYAKLRNFSIESDPAPQYDFDHVLSWCNNPDRLGVDCKEFLNFWNMFSDISASIGRLAKFRKVDRGLSDIYDKLFFGSNLPAITPEGESYTPAWSDTDVDAIASLFREGLRDLQRCWPNKSSHSAS